MLRVAVLTLGLSLLAPRLAVAAPFTAPNLSPPVLIHGGPSWTVSPEPNQRLTFELTTAVANHFSSDNNGGSSIRLDGETRYLHWGIRSRLRDRWLVGFDLSWLQHTPGKLDRVIDGWHDFFGLPNGGRDRTPRDQLQFRYANGGNSIFDLTQRVTGMGDTRIGVGRILGPKANWLLWGELKLPSGDEQRLTGSGAVDSTLSLTQRGTGQWRERALDWYWGVSASSLGNGDLVGAPVEDWVMRLMAGMSYSIWSRVAFVTQLEAATPHYGGGLDATGKAALPLTLGAKIRLGTGSSLNLALVEDLSVDSSPDVTFLISFTINR